jgi:hypothetical protein
VGNERLLKLEQIGQAVLGFERARHFGPETRRSNQGNPLETVRQIDFDVKRQRQEG